MNSPFYPWFSYTDRLRLTSEAYGIDKALRNSVKTTVQVYSWRTVLELRNSVETTAQEFPFNTVLALRNSIKITAQDYYYKTGTQWRPQHNGTTGGQSWHS